MREGYDCMIWYSLGAVVALGIVWALHIVGIIEIVVLVL